VSLLDLVVHKENRLAFLIDNNSFNLHEELFSRVNFLYQFNWLHVHATHLFIMHKTWY